MKKKDILILVVVFISLMGVVFLLKRGEIVKTEEQAKGEKKKPIILKLKDLIVEPEIPLSSSIVRIIPVLETRTRASVAFHYRWFVNGEEIFGLDQNILPGRFLKKNNRVYCLVKARMGIHESREKKSREFVVANSPPVWVPQPVEKFSVPGDFYYKIYAGDPDGDTLEYHLVAPLGKGVKVDSRTGEIRWFIPELPKPEEPTQEVRYEGEGAGSGEHAGGDGGNSSDSDYHQQVIVIEVRDPDGGTTIASLNLDLALGQEATR